MKDEQRRCQAPLFIQKLLLRKAISQFVGSVLPPTEN
jgi:hypothetical protein